MAAPHCSKPWSTQLPQLPTYLRVQLLVGAQYHAELKLRLQQQVSSMGRILVSDAVLYCAVLCCAVLCCLLSSLHQLKAMLLMDHKVCVAQETPLDDRAVALYQLLLRLMWLWQ